MPTSPHHAARRVALLATTVLTLAAAGCDSTPRDTTAHRAPAMPAMPSAGSGLAPATMPPMSGMPAAPGDGLAPAAGGYRIVARVHWLGAPTVTDYRFTVTGPNGKPVTDFAVDQTKHMHLYAIRSDLTGFQHVHPAMAADGTWTAHLGSLTAGQWRLFASFTPSTGPGRGTDLVLSQPLGIAGSLRPVPLPAPATSATVDGYTVTVRAQLSAGAAGPLAVTITRAGTPVRDLEPYLDSFAHLTAFHAGDLAFAHLHPVGDAARHRGGPTLSFHAALGKPGNWRLFIQFQTSGHLHTAALTLRVT